MSETKAMVIILCAAFVSVVLGTSACDIRDIRYHEVMADKKFCQQVGTMVWRPCADLVGSR